MRIFTGFVFDTARIDTYTLDADLHVKRTYSQGVRAHKAHIFIV